MNPGYNRHKLQLTSFEFYAITRIDFIEEKKPWLLQTQISPEGLRYDKNVLYYSPEGSRYNNNLRYWALTIIETNNSPQGLRYNES